MMKPRLRALLLTAALLLVMVKTAWAEEIQILNAASAFCQDGTLYATVPLPEGADPAALTAQVSLNGGLQLLKPELGWVAEGSRPVSYLFLVDGSDSMTRDLQDHVNVFLKRFTEDSAANASFALASFGSGFQIVEAFTSDKAQFLAGTSDLRYDETQTSLYKGILSALDYLKEKDRAPGELENLIVISDGVEYDKSGCTEAEVLDAVRAAPGVAVHTLAFRTNLKGSEEAVKILGSFARASVGGLHTVWDETDQDEAHRIVSAVEQVCSVDFPLPGYDQQPAALTMDLLFFSGENLLYRIDKTAAPALEITPVPPTAEPPASSPAEAPEPVQSAPPSSETPETAPMSTDAGGEAAPDGEKNGGCPWLPAAIAAAALLLLVAAVLLRRRPRRTAAPSGGNGQIYMRLEVLSGHCASKGREFYLDGQLLIGRDRDCDLIWRDKEVSGKNSRVFLRDGLIYVEDLASVNGTALTGVRLYAPSRLRSGDELAIGPVRFRFKF